MPRYYRKVIRIRGEDSPNVRYALAQIERGERPDGEVLVPGVLSWDEYCKRRKMWDEVQQTVSLDGEFYKGSRQYLFPQEYLTRSVNLAARLNGRRRGLALGVDAAEGGDDTCWTVTDLSGVITQLSIKTADTSDVPGTTLGLMREYGIGPESVAFDRGGGGKQHADALRRKGYDVRTIGFGEAANDPHEQRKTATIKPPVFARVESMESVYSFKNRRAEMYWRASSLVCGDDGFAIPGVFGELIRQLKVLPKLYDGEGRIYLPPKDKPHPKYTGETIRQILGRSPDQADSFVLAVFAMLRRPVKVRVGAI